MTTKGTLIKRLNSEFPMSAQVEI
jgi:hypothetical protein